MKLTGLRSYILDIHRRWLFLFAFAALSAGSAGAQSQDECDLKFEYEVTDTSGGQANGTIYIRRIEGTGPFTVRLYDLIAAKQEFEDTRQFDRIDSGKRVKVFEQVASGTYLIRVENALCSRSLSGIEGIVVK